MVFQLKYHDSGREANVHPHVGQWNMIDKVKYQIFLSMFKYKVSRKNVDFYVFYFSSSHGSVGIRKHKDYLGSDLMLLLPKSYPSLIFVVFLTCIAAKHLKFCIVEIYSLSFCFLMCTLWIMPLVVKFFTA